MCFCDFYYYDFFIYNILNLISVLVIVALQLILFQLVAKAHFSIFFKHTHTHTMIFNAFSFKYQ